MTIGRMIKSVRARIVPAVFFAFLVLFSCGAAQAEDLGSDGLPKCPDAALAQTFRDSARAYFTISNDAITNTHVDMNAEYAKNPQRYAKGKILDTYCIGIYLDYFSLIRKLIAGASAVELAIQMLAEQLMNYICEQIGVAVENALEKLCVPLPDLGFSLSLPSSRAGSCNGISMADLIKVTPGIPLQTAFPVPQNLLSAPLSRMLLGSDANGRF